MTDMKRQIELGEAGVKSPCAPGREFPFSDGDFQTLSDLIFQRTGIVLKSHKKDMVYSRLARRLRSLGISSFSDYVLYLTGTKGDAEISALINAITTNLTRFFRESHHFDHLSKTVLPEVLVQMSKGTRKRLRIWSAGCSSGEEPYSIAMVLDKQIKAKGLEKADAKILATDLDTNMLRIGRKGDYKSASVSSVGDDYMDYIQKADNATGKIHISSELRNYISFKPLNLLADWPMKGPFDVIFCRNVMIYFDSETKNKLTRRFVELLRPGGWLFVGHSETILGADESLSLYGRTIYQRKRLADGGQMT